MLVGSRENLIMFSFLKKSLYLLEIHIEVFTDAMISLGFTPNNTEIGRCGCADETQWGHELKISEAWWWGWGSLLYLSAFLNV